ncbi:MAG: class I SAM-dependent methyltransferase [Simkaniaceae bacterium]
MPSSKKAILAMITLMPVDFQGKVVDLGSGFGSLIFEVSKRYPKARVVGIEHSLIPFLFSKLRLLFQKRKNITLLYKDFFDVDLSDFDLILCYLYRGAMLRLKKKFLAELKGDKMVISNTFSIPEQIEKKAIRLRGLISSEIYLYNF